ncbi:hypothetical protein [Methylomicrobium lacus]|uniref:hypothetical protein n=1 Tax=Methylomicrobium lacus TaxID=136992 RepID=UPI00045E5AF0|nr:hypothetical protein [Methylomicrobium lacus]
MSYFLWIEDFDNSAITTASNLFSGIIDKQSFSDNKRQLKANLEKFGVFIETSLDDGLRFIRNDLNKIDYIILDIDLPAYTGEPSTCLLELLEKFHGYKKPNDESEDEALLGEKCKEVRPYAGFHIYSELVIELGFPKQNILFCSQNGDKLSSTLEAFESAKIKQPNIYPKSEDSYAHEWILENSHNSYSKLRRGIIEGCQYAKKLDSSKLYFKNFTNKNEPAEFKDLISYLEILEAFLPLQEPKNKHALYKLFVRTLSHEWDSAKFIKRDKEKNDAVLAWIMRNTRHWITHNSNLFSEINEKLVAYLFMINMLVMFNYGNGDLHGYEKILLSLFEKEALSENDFKSKTIPVSETYLSLKNIVLDESHKKDIKIEDAFYFNELANNIQLSNSPVRNDKQLFIKLLYQMFWLCTSNPFISTGNRKSLLEIKFYDFKYEDTTYMFELARHIFYCSFPPE